MSDLPDKLSDTNDTAMAIAPLSVNPNTNVWAITPSVDSTSTGTAIAQGSTNPYLVYLSQLGVGSRRTMHESLERIAQMMSGGELNALNFPWSELRYQHTQAIYTHLLETRAPATVNKMIAALGRVLKEAWKLGQMSAEDYHRAIAIERRTGQRLLKGRALSTGEVGAILSVCWNGTKIR